MNTYNFKNDHWVLDYCPVVHKGEVIRLADEKHFYFSDNMGLPYLVPQYVRTKAKEMIQGGKTP